MDRIRIDVDLRSCVFGHSDIQKMHIERGLVAAKGNIGDFETGFGCAVEEEGTRIGGGTERFAVAVSKCCKIDAPVDGVNVAVRTENPVGMGLFEEIEIAVARVVQGRKDDEE